MANFHEMTNFHKLSGDDKLSRDEMTNFHEIHGRTTKLNLSLSKICVGYEDKIITDKELQDLKPSLPTGMLVGKEANNILKKKILLKCLSLYHVTVLLRGIVEA